MDPPLPPAHGRSSLPYVPRQRAALPCGRWGGSATVHPARATTLPTAGPCVGRGCRTRPVPHPWLGNRRPFLHRLRPPRVANP